MHERDAFRDEVADPPFDANGHAIHLGQGAQTVNVYLSNVAGSLTCNRNIQQSRKGSCDFCALEWLPRLRHQLIDDDLGFTGDAVDDVVYASRLPSFSATRKRLNFRFHSRSERESAGRGIDARGEGAI
jgi:hypothetical protein